MFTDSMAYIVWALMRDALGSVLIFSGYPNGSLVSIINSGLYLYA